MNQARKNISDYIYETIKNEILDGELNFGDKIVEIDYSKKLNVSRTPLREAIKKLEIENIIERLPNGRLRIIKLDKNRIIEVFQIRSALENLLLVSIKDSPEALRKLEKNLTLTKFFIDSKDWISARKLFSEYNNLFYTTSTLEFIPKILKNYDFLISALRVNSLKSHERIQNAYEEHFKIYKYLVSGSIEEATELNKNHLHRSEKLILSLIDC